MKSKEKIFEEIVVWEESMGECFYDYFCHDNISNVSWAFFLLGKGFVKHANDIVNEHVNNDGYVGQEELYELKPVNGGEIELSVDEERENWRYNMEVMSEFLSLTDFYQNKLTNFFKETK